MVRASLLALASLTWIALPGGAIAAGPEAGGKKTDQESGGDKAGAKKKSKGAKASGGSAAATGAGKGAAMKKRIGFGAIRTLSSVNGLFANGYLTNRITLGMVFGVATFTFRQPNEDGDFEQMRTVGRLGIGPEVFFYPVQGDRSSQVHADF